MRVSKFISQCGVASRRSAENLILEGRVKVNDSVIFDLGHQIDEAKDKVFIDDKLIKLIIKNTTIVFNKPSGCLCTKNDPQNRKTVYDYLPSEWRHLKYVGRLDFQSRGLLLLTDDGELLYRLTHPKYEVSRTYFVWTNDPLNKQAIQKLVTGIDISDSKEKEDIAIATEVILHEGFIEITLKEGKNREIRRMLKSVGYEIRDLKRVYYGGIQLGDLPIGKFRKLNSFELKQLHLAVHL